jgi:hypothetical protein
MTTKQVVKKEQQNIAVVNPENLLTKAIEQGATVEAIEKLLLMRKDLKSEWAREQYFRSLSLFQKECPSIKKNQKVDFTSTRTNRRTKYNYADLEQIISTVKDLLEKHGFSYTIKTQQSEYSVTAICHANHVDGHSETTSFAIPIEKEAYMNNAQKVASALTYAKRYAFSNAFGILTADDDDDARAVEDNPGNKNKPTQNKTKSKPKKSRDDMIKYAHIKQTELSKLNSVFDEEWFTAKKLKITENEYSSLKDMTETQIQIYIDGLEWYIKNPGKIKVDDSIDDDIPAEVKEQ